MTLQAAEQYVSKPGEVDSIAVVAQPGISQQEIVDRIQRVLPTEPPTEAITGAQITKENQDNIQKGISMFFNFLIRPFAVVAVLVSVFSIYNTFSIIVAQRTREMALLRALGARAGKCSLSVIGEAFVVGVVASVVGSVRRPWRRHRAEGAARCNRVRRAIVRDWSSRRAPCIGRSPSASVSPC